MTKKNMKKKIISIGILGLLLLTGLVSVSAETINEVNMETFDEVPDLKISLSSSKRGVFVVTLENVADIPAVLPGIDYYLIFELEVHKVYNISGSEVELYATTFVKYANSVFEDEIPAHYSGDFEFEMLFAGGENFKFRGRAVVDVGGYIPESDWQNNYDELDILPRKSKTCNRAFNIPLLNVFEKLTVHFPLLQRLLELL